jgi:predicted GNAT family N-acyltransferase
MNYTITPTNWQTDQSSLRQIRERVFIQEQQVPIADEWDDKDETATHFLVQTEEGKAIACARLLVENHPDNIVFHIGRVAVLADFREQGVGRQLMNVIISHCRQQHPDYRIYLHAQTSRQNFYEHLGFVVQGIAFMDAGIPHIEMWLA